MDEGGRQRGRERGRERRAQGSGTPGRFHFNFEPGNVSGSSRVTRLVAGAVAAKKSNERELKKAERKEREVLMGSEKKRSRSREEVLESENKI